MRVLLLSEPPDLGNYVAELFKTWGFPLVEIIGADSLPASESVEQTVILCPAGNYNRHTQESLITLAEHGATIITCLPNQHLAATAGITIESPKEVPLRLRITTHPATGVAGELLPIVGQAATWKTNPDVSVLAYLSHPGKYHDESPGIVQKRIGRGNHIALAFDLPLCVLLLRQGDPQRAEFIPEGDGCARPSHLAADIGPNDAGWLPYADLLARLLVDLVKMSLQAPVPLLSHLPAEAPGILLYSGDEDNAEVAWNEDEFTSVSNAGGRMNLYIIPIQTRSTPEDVQRYRTHNDIGPHPNLRPLDGRPVSERVAEFDRQLQLFKDMFEIAPRSVRNHCTAWAGYMDLVEVMEKHSIRMDGNYFSGTYMRDREGAPYAAFGSALPVRFCQPNGRVLNVYQQHTHLTDDGSFGPDQEYSFKFSPETFSTILDRIYTDIVTRFHTPYAVCIHPSNWVKFSGEQGRELLRQARQKKLPIWSFDQWADFWDARDGYRIENLTWDGSELTFDLHGQTSHPDLRFLLPISYEGASLQECTQNDRPVQWQTATRYRTAVALLPIAPGTTRVRAHYA